MKFFKLIKVFVSSLNFCLLDEKLFVNNCKSGNLIGCFRETFSKCYNNNNMKIPQDMQAVLCSVNINNLDIKRDQAYIIHQVLSHGQMQDIVWLFKTYSKTIIKNVFLSNPYKDYRDKRFHFVKAALLNLQGVYLNKAHYVKNIPRDIR